MVERKPTHSELRLRRLTEEEPDPQPRGILEIFGEPDEPDAADAALTRDAGSVVGEAGDARQQSSGDDE